VPQAFTSWKTSLSLRRFRVAKFKQRRQIQTRFKHLENVQIGGCTGLSFGWLQHHMREPGHPPAGRIIALDSDRSWVQIDYFAEVFNGTAAPSYQARVDAIAPFALGQGSCVMQATNETGAMFEDAIKHFDDNPGHHAIIMVLGKVDTNHVCAAHQGDTTLRFFDPNSGEYVVGNGQRRTFFQALAQQYGTYVSATGKRININVARWEFFALGRHRARR
jgi:hypothetical protein